jgi:hypothetical protein
VVEKIVLSIISLTRFSYPEFFASAMNFSGEKSSIILSMRSSHPELISSKTSQRGNH